MKKALVASVLVLVLALTGCMTHVHTVGSGPAGNDVVMQRQWYVLWGLVPINNVDSKAMAGGADNYQIVTQSTPLDIVIGFFTGIASVYPQSVIVTK